MKVTFELWQLITLALTLIGGFGGLLKLLLMQFAGRMEERLEALAAESRGWRQVERELMQLRVELPERYVRREDYVRNQTIIEGKLDLINSKIELMQIQGAKRD